MTKKFLYLISILMLLAACGPAPEPALSAEDVQNTALPLAMTSVAITQAAIPTATLIPPTPTLTFTPLPSSTPFPTLAPVTSTSQASDPCNEPVPPLAQGEKVSVRFVNKSGGNVNLAFGMNQENSLGECGTYTVTLGIGDISVVEVMAGCYWGYAWIDGNKPSIAKSVSAICLTDPGQVRGVSIGAEVIGFD